MGQNPVHRSGLWQLSIFSEQDFTLCTVIKQMSIYSPFPEVEYFQPFCKGQRCLLTDCECMRDNLETIMEFYSFYLYSYYPESDNDLNHMLQLENAQLACPCAVIQSFSTYKMFIGTRKDVILDKHLNKSSVQVSLKETTFV